MTRSKLSPRDMKRALAFSEWLYGLFLHTYPATFRQAYGSRMAHAFRDSCRDALQRHGWVSLIPFWLHTLSDLVSTGCLERWHLLKEKIGSMTATQNISLHLGMTIGATSIAFVVSLLASINLYLIEDVSHLTQAAYAASPLLRFSYDGIYLSALAAGVAMCAIVGYACVQQRGIVAGGLIVVALLVVFGGFGGLLFRHALTFLIFLVVFLVLMLISLLVGWTVTVRLDQALERRPAAILGACVSVGSILLVNVVALILHTLILNPVSHELYMQGQIGGTHLNFSLIAMVVAFLTLIVCVVSLGRAVRLPSYQV